MSLPNHSHKDEFLTTNSYITTLKDRAKIKYDMFISVALINSPPTAVFITQNILQRQKAV